MTIKQQKISNTMTNGNKIRMFTNHVCRQRGRKVILDGGTQLNNKNSILQKLSLFSNFYSIKCSKDGGS